MPSLRDCQWPEPCQYPGRDIIVRPRGYASRCDASAFFIFGIIHSRSRPARVKLLPKQLPDRAQAFRGWSSLDGPVSCQQVGGIAGAGQQADQETSLRNNASQFDDWTKASIRTCPQEHAATGSIRSSRIQIWMSLFVFPHFVTAAGVAHASSNRLQQKKAGFCHVRPDTWRTKTSYLVRVAGCSQSNAVLLAPPARLGIIVSETLASHWLAARCPHRTAVLGASRGRLPSSNAPGEPFHILGPIKPQIAPRAADSFLGSIEDCVPGVSTHGSLYLNFV